jgi:hypothetical protein
MPLYPPSCSDSIQPHAMGAGLDKVAAFPIVANRTRGVWIDAEIRLHRVSCVFATSDEGTGAGAWGLITGYRHDWSWQIRPWRRMHRL